jgi:hypothetical protein
MKSIIGLVIASLLAVAVVAVAIPNTVEGDWCNASECFSSKSECKNDPSGTPCVKLPKSKPGL